MSFQDPSRQVWIVHSKPDLLVQALTPLFIAQHCRVRSFRSAVHLEAELEKERPDGLILHRQIGTFDGLAISRALKNNPLTDYVPILMTGLDPSGQDIDRAVESGIDTFLCEPLNPAELIGRVQLMLRKNQTRDEFIGDHQATYSQLLVELESARMMSDNIVSNLTHELRTPLLQIKISVKELKTQGTADVDQTVKLIDHAYAATLRLESVVQKLFQFSTAMRSQKTEPFLIQDVMRAVKLQVERDLEQHGRRIPTISCVFNPIALPAVSSERLSITQVLTQLVDNAAKFSNYDRPVHLIAAKSGDYIQVTVQDQGIGIDPSQYEAIFAPYYQVDCSLTRHYGGSGLGLAIVKLILDRLAIPIRIDSQIGQGTSFRFVLPIADFSADRLAAPVLEAVPVGD